MSIYVPVNQILREMQEISKQVVDKPDNWWHRAANTVELLAEHAEPSLRDTAIFDESKGDYIPEAARLMAQKLAERMVAQAADMAQNQAEMTTAMSNQITFNAVKGTLEDECRSLLKEIRDLLAKEQRAAMEENDQTGPWLPVGICLKMDELLKED